MVLIVTLYTTVQTVRTSQRILASTKYTSLLLYTGVIQFVLLLIFDILDILFDVLAIGTIETNLSQVVIINEGLSTIIICRLILNLRSVHLQDGSQDSLGTTRSSVRFTNSIIGNLGAPTRRDSLSFNSAELDNILENEETIYSENPLEVAMVDQIEEMEIEMV
ncbi:hypothetical protein K474DRAFT_819095 [Panus rudis PR-1116 ss-1]|nr:hypothetical protein K474DRAFT_819095 [Panus rudis PR-1116 ss-1]